MISNKDALIAIAFTLSVCIVPICLAQNPLSTSSQFEELGERRFALTLTALGGDKDGSHEAWRAGAQQLCQNPNWLGEPRSNVSFLNKQGVVEHVLTGQVFCLTGFKDSRLTASDAQFKQLIELPKSDFNVDVKTPLYDLLKQRNFDEFLSEANTAVNSFKSGEIDEWQITALYDQALLNDPEQVNNLQDLLSAQPDNAVAHLLLSLIQRDLAWDIRGNRFSKNVSADDFDEFRAQLHQAKEHVDRARALDPELPLVWSTSFSIYKALSSLNTTLVPYLFQESLKYQPESLATHTAYFNFLDPKWHGSRELMQWLIADTRPRYALNPDLKVLEALLILQKGSLLEQRGLIEEAREKYIAALELHPHPSINSALANITYRHSEYELARKYLNETLKFLPLSSATYISLMEIAAKQQDYIQAMRLADAAAKLDKQATRPLYLRVQVFMYYRRYEDAAVELNTLLARDKENSLHIQQLLAMVEHQMVIRDKSL